MTVNFTITIVGSGNTIDECWADAATAFAIDPGLPPKADWVLNPGYEIIDDDYTFPGDGNEDEDRPTSDLKPI